VDSLRQLLYVAPAANQPTKGTLVTAQISSTFAQEKAPRLFDDHGGSDQSELGSGQPSDRFIVSCRLQISTRPAHTGSNFGCPSRGRAVRRRGSGSRCSPPVHRDVERIDVIEDRSVDSQPVGGWNVLDEVRSLSSTVDAP